MLRNAQAYNIRVVNLSMGHPVFESYTDDPLCQAAQKLIDAGIVVVASAGNSGKVVVDGEDGAGLRRHQRRRATCPTSSPWAR